MTRLLPLLVLGVAAGCGGMVVLEQDDGGAGGDDGSVTVSTGDASSGSGGTGKLTPDIVDVKLLVDCQPVVGPDPVHGSVTVSYQNGSTAPGSLELFNASIYVSTANEGWVFPLELSPTNSGVVGPKKTVTVEHAKVATPGDSSFICSLCGMEATLVMNWDQPDMSDVADSTPFFIGCAL